jgi:hypothetical protein
VHDLDLRLDAYIAGITFPDSTTSMTLSSNSFSPNGSDGIRLYRVIRGPTTSGHLCHTIHVFQGGVAVSY